MSCRNTGQPFGISLREAYSSLCLGLLDTAFPWHSQAVLSQDNKSAVFFMFSGCTAKKSQQEETFVLLLTGKRTMSSKDHNDQEPAVIQVCMVAAGDHNWSVLVPQIP